MEPVGVTSSRALSTDANCVEMRRTLRPATVIESNTRSSEADSRIRPRPTRRTDFTPPLSTLPVGSTVSPPAFTGAIRTA